MKTKFIILTAVFSLILISCKNEEKTTTEEGTEVANQNVKENFSLEMDVICTNKEDFSMFYTEDGTINFNADQVAWTGVEPKATSQKVVFNLKEEIMPTNIRIDFGIVQDRGDVTLEKFKLNYYGKTFEAQGSDFLKYFIPNENVKADVDPVKGTIRFQKIADKPYTPSFYPQQTILDEIKKILK
ncbi:hypothetical protein [Flavobacterium sp.]|uniref:hypothetical protein n=1 Tax=Flavobacterium sp. TaxID=239 RepID=UPI00391C27BB